MATLPIEDVTFRTLVGRISRHPEEVISSRTLASIIREATGQQSHRPFVDRLLGGRHLEPIVGQRNINRYRIPRPQQAVAAQPEPIVQKLVPAEAFKASPQIRGILHAADGLQAKVEAFRRSGIERGILEVIALSDAELRSLLEALQAARQFSEDLRHLHDIAPRLRANRCMTDPD